jgi:hypothetical protein
MRWRKQRLRRAGPQDAVAPEDAVAPRDPVEQACLALRDEDVSVRTDAARQLMKWGDRRGVGPLLDALDQEVSSAALERSAEAVIDALAQFGGAAVEARLLGLLSVERLWCSEPSSIPDQPPFVAALDWVAVALMDIGGAELLLRGVLDVLRDQRRELRSRAAGELRNMAGRITVGYGLTPYDDEQLTDGERGWLMTSLHEAFLAEDDIDIRIALAEALGGLGDVGALLALRSDEHLSDEVKARLAP